MPPAGRLSEWLEPWAAPQLDWVQVEVTSRCNAACIYCPHTIWRERWRDRDIPLATFRQLLPSLRFSGMVHLQGWGEPLLHPEFFAMVRLAKELGCRVGTTVNGTQVDGDTAASLVRSAIDLVSFSIAGTDAANDRIRKGTRLAQIRNGIRMLQQLKRKHGLTRPHIHLSYLLLRSQIAALHKLPDLAAELSVDQVIIATLDFVPSPKLLDETIRPRDETEYRQLDGMLDRIASAGKERGVPIHYYLKHPTERQPICTENVQRALFVSSDGSISPCVFLNLPVLDRVPAAEGTALPYEKLVFGNADRRRLTAVWHQTEYRAFRSSFESGVCFDACRRCAKLYMKAR